MRGAVLTETVIVIVFFIVVFGCLSFVHRLYHGKLGASRRAREEAWTQAMTACAGASGGGTITTPVRRDTEALFGRATGLEILASPVSFVRRDQTSRITPSRSTGLQAAEVRSRQTVTCNERVIDIDPHIAAEIAWHGLTGW